MARVKKTTSPLEDSQVKNELARLKAEKLKVLEAEAKFQEELPHRYGWKWYKWAREFYESRNKECFLVAANQVSKSSSQIRKCIEWATNKDLWPILWRTKPRQFWYLYPTKEVASIEIQTKWIPEFMPRGSLKGHPQYGWRIEKDGRNIAAIHFNSGVSIYFKAYSQDESHLQSSSVHYIACDEELPESLYDELSFRRSATDGYFSMVFTATQGQQIWFDTMEEVGTEREKFKHAWKKCVSMYDCMVYEDGSPSHWSKEKIDRVVASCKSEAEVKRRVYGRFIKDEGLKYGAFEMRRNVCEVHPIPYTWHYYAGVDIGAGGDKNHPSSICIVAVAPDFKSGRVVGGWQGKDRVTTMGDVLEVFKEKFCPPGRVYAGLFYDYHAKDFGTLAQRAGLPFMPAEKSHEIGQQVVNTLFKNDMLKVFNVIELQDLMRELMSVPIVGDKRKLLDDFADSLRYATTKINWNFEDIGSAYTYGLDFPKSERKLSLREESFIANREKIRSPQDNEHLSIEQELNAWAELYDY